MVSPMVVVIHKLANGLLQLTRQVVVFEQHPILHRLMPAFDLALGLWVKRQSTANKAE